MDAKNLKLSFDDSSVSINKYGNKTVVAITSYFSANRLAQYFKEIGFDMVPSFVIDSLRKHGYSYDGNTGGWTYKCIGTSTCHQEDDYDVKVGYSIAMSRAKMAAYDKAGNFMSDIQNKAIGLFNMMSLSSTNLDTYYFNEEDSIQLVSTKGFINPDCQILPSNFKTSTLNQIH